ncbi:alpha-D-ribose 1-methylphosphonate 5-triphosphate diphosphatase [Sulfitobacter mediterraneus]|uniref:alpha-D-ribose 1-methylphosphonate 5-triphosphate diphosphatase n=1 Tax=Sulfitobacter mediterraneus TaxID=83219 RepID=UPI00193AA569|nr:alpha-D-ribose 1-methylphosphonate 5-triphosphate diphosphatase [Sulfitobacter mediterraneus]MBM1556049.1 alpha-D-ribose 1-methylphosphonate 5-triphosphate diphosphatase [Sulfitobacter mediterraneus]MBM1567913.1 alpha-D-ribose 1-methylphosphonate 5-triphosphate diphosphatase [Sulfitobacter mediterraneus]MBM1571403.1 alpha-D-ribose 1-methylphosphonate 5-triphosphate diphosphatase [Sulfitobacter mediterraneus]MBM1575191.1 alpha-D-ribose 1-methylphosphonate 5-triphosphate diphosphatase [Sulfito
MTHLDLTGAEVLLPGGLGVQTVSFAKGIMQAEQVGRTVDLTGFLVLPGIIDLHGDAFERHLAPRRGAMKQMNEGLIAAEAELAANGITTAVLAQFVSWEGGLRGLDFADQVFGAIRATAPDVVTDLRAQLRFETHMLDLYAELPDRIRQWGLSYVVFNDHLPHDRLAAGKTPKRMVGQALKAGRNPDVHLAMMQDMHARRGEVPAALDALCATLAEAGVQMGSHDDQTIEDRAIWRGRGVRVAEFPETQAAAEAAHAAEDAVVMGAPNVVRGGSHNGNLSAVDLIAMGMCDALASDYHYPSPRRAALMLADTGLCDLAAAWHLVSAGPAKVLGLADRGTLAPGMRADMVILHKDSRRVAATLAGGQFSYLSGEIAERFIG